MATIIVFYGGEHLLKPLEDNFPTGFLLWSRINMSMNLTSLKRYFRHLKVFRKIN